VADGVRRVERAHLFPQIGEAEADTLQRATRRFQAGLLARALQGARWDVGAAAPRLALRESHLDTLIRTYQLEPSE
jgi:hypothetical protein